MRILREARSDHEKRDTEARPEQHGRAENVHGFHNKVPIHRTLLSTGMLIPAIAGSMIGAATKNSHDSDSPTTSLLVRMY